MIRIPYCAKPGLLLGFGLLQFAQADDTTWQGKDSADWGTAGNWTHGTPDSASKRAVFNGIGPQANVTFENPDNYDINGVLVDGGQKSPLSISNGAQSIQKFRLAEAAGIVIQPGAGPFSLGSSGTEMNLISQFNAFFQNDSVYPATLGRKIIAVAGGRGAPFKLRFTGSGQWIVEAVISNGGSPAITKDGFGTTTLAGLNTYLGATVIRAGILKAGVMSTTDGKGAFGQNSAVFLSNTPETALDIAGFNTSIGSLSGGGDNGGDVILGTATLTVGSNNITSTYAGNISGPGGLLKIGTGTQILTGTNTYTAATAIRSGSLLINTPSGSGLKSETVTVEKNAILGGTGTFSGSLTVRGGGILSGDGIQSLMGGGLMFNSNSIYTVELDSLAKKGTEADLFVANGDLRLDGPVELRLADIATAPTPFVVGKVFSLINYSGIWNGGANNGFFSWGDRPLTNGAKFTVGPNTWMITYDSRTGGGNFPDDQIHGRFVNIIAVPGPNDGMNDMFGKPTLIALGAIYAGLLGVILVIYKRRRRKPASGEDP